MLLPMALRFSRAEAPPTTWNIGLVPLPMRVTYHFIYPSEDFFTVRYCYDSWTTFPIAWNWTVFIDTSYANSVYTVYKTIKGTAVFWKSTISRTKYKYWTTSFSTLQ